MIKLTNNKAAILIYNTPTLDVLHVKKHNVNYGQCISYVGQINLSYRVVRFENLLKK